jgi:hypothetical protein
VVEADQRCPLNGAVIGGEGRYPRVKEDVLEQIVDDYLQFAGYFTIHNVRFKPDPSHPDFVAAEDVNPSDVDVVGFHPTPPSGIERVVVVTCKAWQEGFNPNKELAALHSDRNSHGKPAWRSFRELWKPKWSDAFHRKISELTDESRFAYQIAVTRLTGIGTAQKWSKDDTIRGNLRDCSFSFLTLEMMWSKLLDELTHTPASSEIGRLTQLLKAAGLTAPATVTQPSPPMPGSDAARIEDLENEPNP